MARWPLAVAGAAGLALPALALGLAISRPGGRRAQLEPVPDLEAWPPLAPVSREMVRNRDRLRGPLDARLEAFLDWWDVFGDFQVTAGIDGGLRTDAALQEQLWRNKKTNARWLKDTPHGRRAAADLWVYVPGTYRPDFDVDNPATLARYTRLGEAGEAHGLVWGGRFQSLKDFVHFEVPYWRELPYPPERVA